MNPLRKFDHLIGDTGSALTFESAYSDGSGRPAGITLKKPKRTPFKVVGMLLNESGNPAYTVEWTKDGAHVESKKGLRTGFDQNLGKLRASIFQLKWDK